MSRLLRSRRGHETRRMSRLVGIESLERRDVVGEWMVGLAGVGLAAMGPAPGWENPRTAYGDMRHGAVRQPG